MYKGKVPLRPRWNSVPGIIGESVESKRIISKTKVTGWNSDERTKRVK